MLNLKKSDFKYVPGHKLFRLTSTILFIISEHFISPVSTGQKLAIQFPTVNHCLNMNKYTQYKT